MTMSVVCIHCGLHVLYFFVSDRLILYCFVTSLSANRISHLTEACSECATDATTINASLFYKACKQRSYK